MNQNKFNKLLTKIDSLKKGGTVDLSLEEDLSIAVMNLVSLEEHFYFTREKTGKDEYLDLLDEVRRLRIELLGRMIDKHEGETWCISKHLLAATMRIIEVGTKLLKDGNKKEAKVMFDRAYKVYSLFWALRLKLINVKKAKGVIKQSKGFSIETLIHKLVDCCRE